MTIEFAAGSGGALEPTADGCWPAEGVDARGCAVCVTGVATIAESGNAVGFVDTSVMGTSGGGVIDVAAGVAVPVPAGVVPAADDDAAGS